MTRDPCTNYIIDELVSALRSAKIALGSKSTHPMFKQMAMSDIDKALLVAAGKEEGVRRLFEGAKP
jgi:hypothetical protein